MEEKNALEMILDEFCNDPIILYNEKNEPVKFQQLFIYPDRDGEDDRFYAILRPEDDSFNLEEDEALLFELLFDEEKLQNDEIDGSLRLVTDIDIINKVFDAYEKMYAENEAKMKKKATTSTTTKKKTTSKTTKTSSKTTTPKTTKKAATNKE